MKRGTNWRRTNFDLHNVVGIFSSLVLLFTLLLIWWKPRRGADGQWAGTEEAA